MPAVTFPQNEMEKNIYISERTFVQLCLFLLLAKISLFCAPGVAIRHTATYQPREPVSKLNNAYNSFHS